MDIVAAHHRVQIGVGLLTIDVKSNRTFVPVARVNEQRVANRLWSRRTS